MIICGIKLTHDASIAVLVDGKLEFCVEIEKLNNNKRYSELRSLNQIADVLHMHDMDTDMVDQFVLDGWHVEKSTAENVSDPLSRSALANQLHLAKYHETAIYENILGRVFGSNGLIINGKKYPYVSYMHVTGHILSAYCTSPFSMRNESSYTLVWDGGQYPRLYYLDARTGKIENKGPLFFIHGAIYGIMGHYFGPYKKTEQELSKNILGSEYFGGYSLAGKLMSYMALGNVQHDLKKQIDNLYKKKLELNRDFEHKFLKEIKSIAQAYTDADVLATLHAFLADLLISTTRDKVARDHGTQNNLCFVGGSALNIKWNSALRDSGIFAEVWVPPFPNDSGSAIGAVCCEWAAHSRKIKPIVWDVYSGPSVQDTRPISGWSVKNCSAAELAQLIVRSQEPIVLMNGKAELGPRALGNRSIIAPANNPEMKALLNKLKRREDFRPVAPICMEEHAPQIFNPGTRDPYMLFDHMVRSEWADNIPAILHLDGSARLQTVNEKDNPFLYDLLSKYYSITGIPVLCNTSANLNGSGFFPDVASVMQWGFVENIYSDGHLYFRSSKGQPVNS